MKRKIRTCHYCKTYFQKYKNLPEILKGGFCAGPKQERLVRLAHDRLGDLAGTEATGAYGNRAYFTIGKLMTHPLQVRIEDTIGLDVGVADIMAGLRFFTAHFTLLGHDILHIFGRSPEKIRVAHRVTISLVLRVSCQKE